MPRSPAKPQQRAAAGTATSSAISAATAESRAARPRWRVAHVGWIATRPSFRLDAQVRQQALEPLDRVQDLQLGVARLELLRQGGGGLAR